MRSTPKIIAYKGIGKIPEGLNPKSDPKSRILLSRLPQLLRAYGRHAQHFEMAVVVVVDLDKRDKKAFTDQLKEVLAKVEPAPATLFTLAIEEMEAWLLGDRDALLTAYPKAKKKIPSRYQQDSICDTWELLADAIYRGGAKALKTEGWPAPGQAKCEWAKRIGPYMEPKRNCSPSFQYFYRGVCAFAE